MSSPYLQHSLASLAYALLPANDHDHVSALRKRLIRQLLPYAVTHIGSDMFDTYILLNREHKPLGWPLNLKAHLDYTDKSYSGTCAWVDEETGLSELVPITTQHGTFWYLYGHDVPAPWESCDAANEYVSKLCALLDIEGISEDGARVFQGVQS